MRKDAAQVATTESPKKYVPTKPPGFVEDPEERRRIAEELAGSIPELPPVEEFLKWRRAQTR